MHPTETGCPQGGIISPLLCNIALHGMAKLLGIQYDDKGQVPHKSPYNLIFYADDFVVLARSKEECEQAKHLIKTWLSERGLELSEEKTRIKHITKGFDFLGFNIRRYKTKKKKNGYVLLIQPSKESIKAHKQQMKEAWKKVRSWTTTNAIRYLNSKLIGWCNYFKTGVSKRIFSKLSHWMWQKEVRFVKRRHPNKCWHTGS